MGQIIFLAVLFLLCCFAGNALKKAGKARERKEQAFQEAIGAPYVQSAMQFIGCYAHPPKKAALIVTPDSIGIRMPCRKEDGCPVIYLDLRESDPAKRRQYARAIQRQYKALYHRKIRVYHLSGC